jgi:hypothetical protein
MSAEDSSAVDLGRLLNPVDDLDLCNRTALDPAVSLLERQPLAVTLRPANVGCRAKAAKGLGRLARVDAVRKSKDMRPCVVQSDRDVPRHGHTDETSSLSRSRSGGKITG